MDLESQIPMPLDEQTGCLGILWCVYTLNLAFLLVFLLFDLQGYTLWGILILGFEIAILIWIKIVDPDDTRYSHLRRVCRDPVTRAHALRGSFNMKKRGCTMIVYGGMVWMSCMTFVTFWVYSLNPKIPSRSETNVSLPFDAHTE
jgi:hypothetical protein